MLELPIISVASSVKGWWDESDREEMRALKMGEFRKHIVDY